MMICIFGVCFPVYQLLPVLVILLKTQWAWIVSVFNRLRGHTPAKEGTTGTLEQAAGSVQGPEAVQKGSRGGPEAVHDQESFRRGASHKLVLVDFQATWCGPCKAIAPTIATMSAQYPDVHFLEVDVDHLREIANEFQVKAMPTFVFLRHGVEVLNNPLITLITLITLIGA
jgi:thioredoxin